MDNFMDLEEFVNRYNNNVPDIKYFLIKKLNTGELIDEKDAYTYRERCIIEVDLGKNDLSRSIVKNIVYNTNIWSVGIANINFYAEFEEERGIYYFADFNEYQIKFGIKNTNVYAIAAERIYSLFNEKYFVALLLVYQKLNYDFFIKNKKKMSQLDRGKIDFFNKLDASGLIVEIIFSSIPFK